MGDEAYTKREWLLDCALAEKMGWTEIRPMLVHSEWDCSWGMPPNGKMPGDKRPVPDFHGKAQGWSSEVAKAQLLAWLAPAELNDGDQWARWAKFLDALGDIVGVVPIQYPHEVMRRMLLATPWQVAEAAVKSLGIEVTE